MINIIKENRSKYHNIIVNKIDDYFYKRKRYGQHFSLAVGLSDPDINLSVFNEHNRQTDMFIVLEKNLCCEVFDGTSAESGIKAAAILLTSFESHFYTKRIFASIVFSNDYDTSSQMVNRLFDILEYAFSHNMENMVVDNSLMIKDY
ncbi:MAG: hypothetical protein WBF77_04940 [Sulfurimonadaceae bacterium]